MSVVAVAAVILLFLATLGTTLMIFPATWQAFRREMRRTPPVRRKRACVGGVAVLVWGAALAGVLISEPWGSDTVVWVVIGITALLLGWACATAVIQGMSATRRARVGRRERQ